MKAGTFVEMAFLLLGPETQNRIEREELPYRQAKSLITFIQWQSLGHPKQARSRSFMRLSPVQQKD